MHISDMQIRDPFVVLDDGTYYLFGSTDKDIWKSRGVGFDVYISKDGLDEFEGPFPAFRPEADFWSETNFWAPEVHRYKGEWYMFATFKPKDGRRGTAILKSEAGIMGPYLPWSLNASGKSGPITPAEWECLDGTFFEEDGVPYMVFCHEWQQVGDGEIRAMPLSNDLQRSASTEEPLLLFRASEAPWAFALKNRAPGSFVTDGPFMYRAENGSLFMLWSSFDEDGAYCIGIAHSESGKLIGPWKQEAEPLYKADGGHGMLFRSKEGNLYLAIHSPNKTPNERAIFVPIKEEGDTLVSY
jgi:GH43 family beta-xylosidase